MRNDIESEVIGVVVRDIEDALRAESPNGFDEPSFEQISKIDAIYREHDHALLNRPDYKLWRLYMKPHYSHRRPWLHDIQVAMSVLGHASLLQLLSACVESDDPVVQWSTVAVAPEIILQNASDAGGISDTDLIELMGRLDGRLRNDFLPLDRCPASCGMATFFFLMSYQHARYKNGSRMGLTTCREFVDSVTTALKLVNWRWTPGLKLDITKMKQEREGAGRLLPGHDAFENVRFTKALSLLRPIISETISASGYELTPLVESLLSDAYELSVSGWLTARSLRISVAVHQRSKGYFVDRRSKNERRDAFKLEMQMLLHLGNAARDAGRYLDSGKMIYLYLKTIPDEFIEESWIQEELKRRSGIFHYVGESGLRKDERFKRDRDQGIVDSKNKRRQIGWDKNIVDAKTADEVVYPVSAGNPTGLALRMAQEMRVLPEWQLLLKHVSAEGQTHWGYLLTVEKNLADGKFEAPSDVLSATFFIALHYGHVRSAGKILDRAINKGAFPIRSDHVIEFVHAVRKATQQDPFGIRLEYLEFWQNLIIDGCHGLLDSSGGDFLPVGEVLWLHETLLNRTITLFGNLPSSSASLLYQSNSGLISAQQMRIFYEEAFDFHRRAPGVANTDTVAQHLSTVFEASGRKSVALSVVRFGEYLSFLAVGRNGKSIAKVEIGAPTDVDVTAISSGASLWFEYPDIAAEDQVFWTPSMVRLATTAIRLAREIEEGVDTIFFAGEPWLMQLPLQHLFFMKGDADVLVCLTPNFSSLSLRRGAIGEPGITEVQSTDDDPEMKALVQNISRVTAEYGEYVCKSVVTIVGHGTPSMEGGLPRVNLGNGNEIVTAKEWLDHLKGDAVLIHSCHLASTEPVHIGDLGGAVGLAFAVGCRTFVGPVTEVFAETAEFLHRKLISWAGGIGDGYMEALRENGEVSLYSFYGDPCLALLSE